MATLNRNLAAFFNTDAEFRAFAQFFHDILTSGGWVNTADTGQVNLSTVAKPAAINTAQGYEIWRMDDGQQAQLPCYMKIEYGSGGVVDRPSVWLTVGTGSNGSGTLTGQLGTRRQIQANASKTAGITLPAFASASSDRFCFFANYDNAAVGFFMAAAVERTADANGTVTADGIITWYNNQAGAASSQVIPPSPIAVPGAGTTNPFCSIGVAGDLSTVGVNVGLMPGIFSLGKPFFMRSFGMYKNADITGGSTITVVESSGNHTFQAFTSAGQSVTGQTGAGNGLAMLYE